MGDYLSRLTFYDLVGYLLPGLVGVCFFVATLSLLSPGWAIPAPSDGSGWTLLVIAAYFVGHVLQGLSARLFRRESVRNKLANAASAHRHELATKVLGYYRITASTNAERYAAIDSLKLNFPDREIFIARQGFFRGASLGFFLLAMPLGMGALLNRPVPSFGIELDRGMCLIVAVVAIGIAFVYLGRFSDFLGYELEFAIAEDIRKQTEGAPRT